jgi:hypothetical protein
LSPPKACSGPSPFAQLSNSKVESQFADARTYIYNRKKVDQQVHLGFDLSVTQHVDVVACERWQVSSSPED